MEEDQEHSDQLLSAGQQGEGGDPGEVQYGHPGDTAESRAKVRAWLGGDCTCNNVLLQVHAAGEEDPGPEGGA